MSEPGEQNDNEHGRTRKMDVMTTYIFEKFIFGSSRDKFPRYEKVFESDMEAIRFAIGLNHRYAVIIYCEHKIEAHSVKYARMFVADAEFMNFKKEDKFILWLGRRISFLPELEKLNKFFTEKIEMPGEFHVQGSKTRDLYKCSICLGNYTYHKEFFASNPDCANDKMVASAWKEKDYILSKALDSIPNSTVRDKQ